MNYYNEFDPKASAWLRELISAGAIPAGDVDARSICDVRPEDLRGYTQCHFFAGIGGWSYAMQLAGWPEDQPVWTGSCPCQPYSTAGKQLGDSDDRNLWPVFFNLIRECRPERAFGEQVANAIGHGWLDGISADLEKEGYACGACVLGAHSVGAPHIRKRLYWVAYSKRNSRWERGIANKSTECNSTEGSWSHDESGRCSHTCGLAHSERVNRGLPDEQRREMPEAIGCGEAGRLGHTNLSGSQGRNGEELRECSSQQAAGTGGAWSDFQLIPCRDGRSRRVESILLIDIDGLSCIMGDDWNNCISKTQEVALKYANFENSGDSKTVFALWDDVCQEALQKYPGRYDTIQSQEVLLLALCESSRRMGRKLVGSAQDFLETEKAIMRRMRGDIPSSRSSYRSGLEKSSSEQSSNAMPSVSHAEASKAGGEMSNLRSEGKGASNVLEALSEIQKIWECLDDEKRGESKQRILTGVGIAIAMLGAPLAKKIPFRVPLLKGAGNAIVPQVAAEFIKAAIE